MRREYRIYHFISLLVLALLIRIGTAWSIHFLWLFLVPIVAVIHGRLRAARGKSGLSPLLVPYAIAVVRLRVFLRYRFGLGRRRRKERSQPRGFCPNCNYPMNPGRCPECGTEVSQQDLPRELVHEFYHHKRKLALLAAVLIFGVGGPIVYFYADWPRLLPTKTLLSLQSIHVRRAEVELVRRYSGGKFKKAEKQAFFDQAMDASYRSLPVYPAQVPFFGHVYIELPDRSLTNGRWFFMREYHVFVDGKEITASSSVGDSISLEQIKGHWIIGGPKLEPGEHDVTIRGTVTISCADGLDLIDPLAIHTGKFSVSTHVRAEDRPASDFVVARVDAETVESMRKRLRAGPYHPSSRRSGRSLNGTAPRRCFAMQYARRAQVPIAAILLIRPAGEGEFEEMGWAYLAPGARRYWEVPEGPRFDNVDRVDVLLDPDPGVAVEHSLPPNTQYYGQKLYFRGIELSQVYSGP